ncbi:hypothetical protein KBB68_04310 [Candidatus Babeliales bacterium]|nr:hypothetical protein [Candidatus Babeliales bacterium]
MKKNLSILLYLLFFTHVTYSDTKIQIVKIAEVLSNVHKTFQTAPKRLNPKTIQFDFTQLTQPYQNPAINTEIATTRERIQNATETLLNITNKKIENISAEDFATKFIQPCYLYILEKSAYPSFMSKTPQFKINSNLPQSKNLEYQLYDALNRIFILWILYKDIFNISDDSTIKFEWPKAELSVLQWKQLTKNITNLLWTSLNPSAKPTDGSHIFKWVDQKETLSTSSTPTEATPTPAIAAKDVETKDEPNISKFEKKSKFFELKPSLEEVEKAKQILTSFKNYITHKKLAHEIFVKYDFDENLGLAITYLSLIQEKFENDEKIPEDVIKELKNKFIEQMNTIYSAYFKKDFAGHFGNEFLVIKHKFAPKTDGTNVPELSEPEAIILLTDLITLWEIYNTLLPDTTFQLSYFRAYTKIPDILKS